MSQPTQSNRNHRRLPMRYTLPITLCEMLHAAWPGFALAAFALTRMVLAGPALIRAGELYDADSFTHISRLRAILATGGWDQGFFLRDNAPHGMVLHWTMPYDLFCLALTSPFALLTGWQHALQIIAPCLGPLSIALLILAAIFAARPLCDRRACQIVGLAVAAAPIVLQYGQIGDADHHIFIAALWTFTLGLMLRVMHKGASGQETSRELAIAAGLMTAFCLWTAVECILVILLGLTLMGLAWIRTGGELRRANLLFAISFASGMTAALLIDPPYGGWMTPDLDRLSIVYVTFAVLFLLLWLLLALMPQERDRWRARLVAAISGGSVAAATLASLFSGILRPERTLFLKDATPDWTASIGEMLPAYHDPRELLAVAMIPAIGLAFAAWRAARHRGTRAGLNWLAYAIFLLPLLALGILHIRFMGYPEIAAAPAFALCIARLRPGLRRLVPNFFALAETLIALVLLLALPALGAIGGSARSTEPASADSNGDCRLQPVAAALRDKAFMGGDKEIMMTSLGLAPEVIYWTDHDVVAGPYHRNVEGIHDEFAFFMSWDDLTAITILTRRGISHVLICPAELKKLFPARPGTGSAGSQSLADRLINGPMPNWLTEQPWPKGTASDIRLYRVNIAKNPDQN